MNDTSTYYQNHRREIVDFLPPSYKTVLEIGCGAGRFRANLDKPNSYWGIEPSAAAAAVAAQHLDKVLPGFFEQNYALLPDGHFDLIICNDVIEHMPDHDQFLQSIKRKMTPNASLVGSVPNVRNMFNMVNLLAHKDWQYKDDGILDRTHLRFFTEKSLARTFVANGYAVERFAGINPEYQRGGILKRGLYGLLAQVLGSDVKYLQFGFRVRPNGG